MTNAVPPEEAGEAPAWSARKLLRAARSGTLATAAAGQPFASLVTPAVAPDGAILLLLSELSEHTRHLRADGRCAVLVAGASETANPQTAPRLTVTGVAAPSPDPALKARWLVIHPYAAFYAGFGDFALWRIAPGGGLFVGGFARATRLRQGDLAPDPTGVTALTASEADILAHCNTDHPDALAAIARGAGAGGEDGDGDWRMVGADTDGCDLADGERVVRIAWAQPVADAGAVRAELVRLARAARAG